MSFGNQDSGYNVLISNVPSPGSSDDVQWIGGAYATVYATTGEAIQAALDRELILHCWIVPFDDQRSLENQCTPDRKVPKIVFNPPE